MMIVILRDKTLLTKATVMAQSGCPVCGAGADAPCTGRRGTAKPNRALHVERWNDWLRRNRRLVQAIQPGKGIN